MSNLGKKFHPQALSTAEVEALMAACSATSPTGKRNRALIVVLWRGALRCEEALHLKVHDLDRGTGNIRVMFGKGRPPHRSGLWLAPLLHVGYRAVTIRARGTSAAARTPQRRRAPRGEPAPCHRSRQASPRRGHRGSPRLPPVQLGVAAWDVPSQVPRSWVPDAPAGAR